LLQNWEIIRKREGRAKYTKPKRRGAQEHGRIAKDDPVLVHKKDFKGIRIFSKSFFNLPVQERKLKRRTKRLA